MWKVKSSLIARAGKLWSRDLELGQSGPTAQVLLSHGVQRPTLSSPPSFCYNNSHAQIIVGQMAAQLEPMFPSFSSSWTLSRRVNYGGCH